MDKDLQVALMNKLPDFVKDLTSIANTISKEDFLQDINTFETNILDRLNQINTTLQAFDQKVNTLQSKQKIKDFNLHLENLNVYDSMITEADIKNIGEGIKKAREVTTKASESARQN